MRGIGLGNSIVFPGQRGGVINKSVNSVSPEYFDVMGIRFLAGRNFAPSDTFEQGKLNKTIVNAAFVRKFLNGRNALGERFATGQRFLNPEFEIIGVVNDTKYRSLREIPPPIFYTYDFGPHSYPDTFILGGTALSSFMSTWVRGILYGVQPVDVATDAIAMLLLIAIGIGGAAVPVFRAIRVNPSFTLHQE